MQMYRRWWWSGFQELPRELLQDTYIPCTGHFAALFINYAVIVV